MPAPFTLRDATPADLPDIHRLLRGLAEYEQLLHLATATEADLQNLLFGPQPFAFAVIAETERRTVGTLLWLHTISTFAGRPGIFVEDVFVEPAHRGKGIGLALFRHVAAIAHARNYICLEWRVLNRNAPALAFYRQLGAKPITEWQTMELRGAALAALAEGADHG